MGSAHAPDCLRALVRELREVDVEHLCQAQELCVVSGTVAPCQPRLQQRIWYACAVHRDVEAESGAFDEGLSQQAAVVDAVDDAARVAQLDARAVAVSAAGPALDATSRASQAAVEAGSCSATNRVDEPRRAAVLSHLLCQHLGVPAAAASFDTQKRFGG